MIRGDPDFSGDNTLILSAYCSSNICILSLLFKSVMLGAVKVHSAEPDGL